MEIENAKITSTMLGIEDHGVLTFFLYLDFGGTGQGFGGYCLDQYDPVSDKRRSSPKSMDLISLIIKTVGVESWENLPGKYIKVKHDRNKVYGICGIVSNEWMMIEDFFSKKE